jgi:hypothetical protein
MSGSFQVPSQGIHQSHALKNLLGVKKHHFGRKVIQKTQKYDFETSCFDIQKP